MVGCSVYYHVAMKGSSHTLYKKLENFYKRNMTNIGSKNWWMWNTGIFYAEHSKEFPGFVTQLSCMKMSCEVASIVVTTFSTRVVGQYRWFSLEIPHQILLSQYAC